MKVVHYTVMAEEVLEWLKPSREGALLIDCTLGEGGHTERFLESYSSLQVRGIDADPEIIKKAEKRLERFGDRFTVSNAYFDQFWMEYPEFIESKQLLRKEPRLRPNMVLMDLGISTFHYLESNRGFSFRNDEDLDMRLSPQASHSAKELIGQTKESDLADLIFQYGEERYSRRIAKAIKLAMGERRIQTSKDLADVIWQVVPKDYRYGRIHPATRTFQALRIAVNDELGRIIRAMEQAFYRLEVGGRMGIISFHSLEDRLVKRYFQRLKQSCICPPEEPICKCGGEPRGKVLTKKPIGPSEREVKENAPSRSAKLRVVEKIREIEEPVSYA